MNTSVKPIPDDMHNLTPHLVCRDANAAMDFYIQAFGATDQGRVPGPDGKLMHGMLRIGDSALMLAEENAGCAMSSPLSLNGSPVTLHLYVENTDATIEQAVTAGARVTMLAEDMFWGDRYGRLVDPFGHEWSIATHVQDLSPEEIQAAMKNACAPA